MSSEARVLSLKQQIRFAWVQYAELLNSGPAHRTASRAQRLADLRARLDDLEAQLAAEDPA